MSEESKITEISATLKLIVRSMVSDPGSVAVSLIPSERFTVIRITVAKGADMGKVIGKQGRTARSLRIILGSIAKEQGLDLLLDVEDSAD